MILIDTSVWIRVLSDRQGDYARGLAICSLIDCCIACLAIEHRALLIHDDRDFDVIGRHFPLQHKRWRFERAE